MLFSTKHQVFLKIFLVNLSFFIYKFYSWCSKSFVAGGYRLKTKKRGKPILLSFPLEFLYHKGDYYSGYYYCGAHQFVENVFLLEYEPAGED